MAGPLLFHSGRIATFAEDGPALLEDGALRIDAQGVIEALGPTAEVAPPEGRAAFPGEVIDLGGNLVLPGLINAHTHLYSALARGMPALPGEPATDFRGVLEQVWWPLDRALDRESTYLSGVTGLLECVRAGVTTVIDHHASEGAVAGSLDALAEAAGDVGVRLSTCFEVTDRDGPAVAAAGLEENARFARAVREDPRPRGGAPTLAATVGLHASFTLGDATLARALELLDGEGLPGVHIHVAEDKADPLDSLGRCGARTVERLRRAELLRPGTICAHAIWIDDAELAILANAGAVVAVNPASNMNNAVGRADLTRLREAGVRIAIGSDGMTGDVLSQLSLAFLARRDQAGDPRVGWEDADALLAGNRAAAEVFFPGAALGTLRAGGPADLAILDYVPWTPLDASNLLGHMLYGELGARVRTVVCGGRVVMRDGRFPDLDLPALSARAREAARALWGRRRPPTPPQET